METYILVILLLQIIIVNGRPVGSCFKPYYDAYPADTPNGHKKLYGSLNDIVPKNNNIKTPENENQAIAYEYANGISPNKDYDVGLDLRLKGMKIYVTDPPRPKPVWRDVQKKILQTKRQRGKFNKKNTPNTKPIAYEYYDDGWSRKDSSPESFPFEFFDTGDYIDDAIRPSMPMFDYDSSEERLSSGKVKKHNFVKKITKKTKREWWREGISTPYVRKYSNKDQIARERSKPDDVGYEIYCQDGFCKVVPE